MKHRDHIIRLLKQTSQALENGAELSAASASTLEKTLQATINNLGKTDNNASGSSMIHIWSDGACSGNPGPGGWGTIIQQNGRYEEISGFASNTTNNIMEMTAALEGIRRTPAGSRLKVTSDSRYLVQGMTEWIHGWKRRNWKKADGAPVLNKSLWMALDREAQLREIQWCWVKGHDGHPQNERCDELARAEIIKAGRS